MGKVSESCPLWVCPSVVWFGSDSLRFKGYDNLILNVQWSRKRSFYSKSLSVLRHFQLTFLRGVKNPESSGQAHDHRASSRRGVLGVSWSPRHACQSD